MPPVCLGGLKLINLSPSFEWERNVGGIQIHSMVRFSKWEAKGEAVESIDCGDIHFEPIHKDVEEKNIKSKRGRCLGSGVLGALTRGRMGSRLFSFHPCGHGARC